MICFSIEGNVSLQEKLQTFEVHTECKIHVIYTCIPDGSPLVTGNSVVCHTSLCEGNLPNNLKWRCGTQLLGRQWILQNRCWGAAFQDKYNY